MKSFPAIPLFLALASLAAAESPQRHVVVISVDGCPAYLLGDRKAPLPNIRCLASEGVAAEGMRVSNPSVTWPNHTTLVTGVPPQKHGVLANGFLVRGETGMPTVIDAKRAKSALVQVPTLFDAAHVAGLTTADVNWPCTREAGTLDDSFPDVPESLVYTTPRLREELVAAGILRDATDATFKEESGPGRDLLWTEAACHIIRRRKPNLLLLHLLNVDSTHHSYGAQSSPGYTAVAYADACIGKVLAALDDAGIRRQTTVFVVADHGFTATPQALKPNVLLRQEGLLTAGRGGRIETARVHVFPEGGIGLVYLTDPSSREEDRKRVRTLFTGKEGIERILEPADYAEFGLPDPRANGQMSDLVLVAKDGYGFSASGEGDELVVANTAAGVPAGSHGFISTSAKMNALFVAAGAGIKPGAKLGLIDNTDVAPTAAKILGVKLPGVEGQVLEGILAPRTAQ